MLRAFSKIGPQRFLANSRILADHKETNFDELFGELFKSEEVEREVKTHTDVPVNYSKADISQFNSFKEYFPHSPFAMLGSGKDIRIAAKVTMIGNFPDMWVDYGGKFDAYCEVPEMQMQINNFGKPLSPGDRVQILLHEPEICAHFLGSAAPVSMREGKATLIGILPKRLLQNTR